MKNVNIAVTGKTMTITVDLSQDFGPSSTGKTRIIASTEGNQSITGPSGHVQVGLNVFKKP